MISFELNWQVDVRKVYVRIKRTSCAWSSWRRSI